MTVWLLNKALRLGRRFPMLIPVGLACYLALIAVVQRVTDGGKK